MIKVYQTCVDKDKGDCMRAAVASIFDLQLDEVPNFSEMQDSEAYCAFVHFVISRGYKHPTCLTMYQNGLATMLKALAFDGGVNGYFIASINSLTFENVLHAVIVDSNLNVVHDPNPNQKAIGINKADILSVYVVNGTFISADGEPVTWDRLTSCQR
jgi:hypothetical protein